MKKTSIAALILLVLLFIIHKLALDGQWYVKYFGLDIFMHLLAGIGLTLGINIILGLFFPNYKTTFWTLIGLTFLAGIGWEIFEALNDIAGAPFGTVPYWLDTAKDLVNDTLGAIIASYFLRK